MKCFFGSLVFVSLTITHLVTGAIAQAQEKESPWLLTPTFSSSPKLGNSLGAMAAYLHKFDEESPTSMFGLMGNYSDTDSSIYGAFGQSFYSADQHRLQFGVMRGDIENEYEDFLGTGLDAITTDDVTINFISYTKRLQKDYRHA